MPSPVIELRGSRRVQAFLCCIVLLALLAIALSHLPWPIQVLASSLVLAGGGIELYCAWPGSRGYLGRLQITRDGRLLCSQEAEGNVLTPATIQHWWTLSGRVAGLVAHREDGRRVRVILFRDQLAPDEWRRLNLCLRLGRSEPEPFT
ncbi:MAG: hypothetical protein Q8N51_19510 [Gammaproteobacteria bacterium]|nr:hypothetical protein [Gammaproteobacteria bacterium]